jgi:hypothetical protein
VEAWKLERSTREGKRVGTRNFRDRGCYEGRERGERGAGFSAVAKALQGVTCLLFFQLLGEFVVGGTAILSPLFHLAIIFSTNQTFLRPNQQPNLFLAPKQTDFLVTAYVSILNLPSLPPLAIMSPL